MGTLIFLNRNLFIKKTYLLISPKAAPILPGGTFQGKEKKWSNKYEPYSVRWIYIFTFNPWTEIMNARDVGKTEETNMELLRSITGLNQTQII